MKVYRLGTILLFTALIFSLFYTEPVFAAMEKNPSTANFYLYTPINDIDARELAKWDVLVLQMLAGDNSAEQLRLIKKNKPENNNSRLHRF